MPAPAGTTPPPPPHFVPGSRWETSFIYRKKGNLKYKTKKRVLLVSRHAAEELLQREVGELVLPQGEAVEPRLPAQTCFTPHSEVRPPLPPRCAQQQLSSPLPKQICGKVPHLESTACHTFPENSILFVVV